MPLEDPALEIVGLSASYRQAAVVRGVSAAVPQGAVLAVAGTNGAGKSALLMGIMNLIRRTSGTLKLSGQEVSSLSAADLVAKGLVLRAQRQIHGSVGLPFDVELSTEANGRSWLASPAI